MKWLIEQRNSNGEWVSKGTYNASQGDKDDLQAISIAVRLTEIPVDKELKTFTECIIIDLKEMHGEQLEDAEIRQQIFEELAEQTIYAVNTKEFLTDYEKVVGDSRVSVEDLEWILAECYDRMKVEGEL